MAQADAAPPVLAGVHSKPEITRRIASIVLAGRLPRYFWAAFALCFALVIVFLYSVTYLIAVGIGKIGVNIPVAWGTMISNFVWWIGIGHAGTLISAVLLLLRQPWRASINRFAEAMAMFAIICAGLYPLIHLGRPWFFYYLLPYPNAMDLWPQWRSPLIWDFFAISTYLIYTMLFLYLSLLPDIATLRDRAKTRLGQLFYGSLALGWRNSAEHWARYERLTMVFAAVAAPIVFTVTGIISLDLSVAIVRGFHFTIFPPYFVAGAIYSGFCTVALLAIVLRAMFGLRDLVTERHLDYIGRMMLAFVLVVDYSYTQEIFTAWYSGDEFYRYVYIDRWTGPYAPAWWTMFFLNVVLAQLLWFRQVRTSAALLALLAVAGDIGMWLERFQILFTSLHADYMPSGWDTVWPTAWDWIVYAGSLGLFSFLMLAFVRVVPLISLHDMRTVIHKRQSHG